MKYMYMASKHFWDGCSKRRLFHFVFRVLAEESEQAPLRHRWGYVGSRRKGCLIRSLFSRPNAENPQENLALLTPTFDFLCAPPFSWAPLLLLPTVVL